MMEEQDFNDLDALGLLQAVYRDPGQSLSVRLRAASLALPFERPKLGAIAYSNVDPAEFAAALDRALERSGKRDAVKLIYHIPEGTK
jgi:hypothetical protein